MSVSSVRFIVQFTAVPAIQQVSVNAASGAAAYEAVKVALQAQAASAQANADVINEALAGF